MSEVMDLGEKSRFRERLRNKHYVPIGVDLSYGDYETAIEAFEDFMRLPEQIVNASKFQVDTRRNTSFGAFERRVGQVNSEGRGLDQDNKNVFHFGALSRQVMEYRIGKNLPADAKWFLSAAEDIYWSAVSASKSAHEKLEIGSAGLVGIHFDERAIMNHHIRFVTYFPREGKILATPHYDRSVGTIALAENKPGLWIEIDGEKQYIPPRETGEGLFFLGRGWDKLPDCYKLGNMDLSPAYHGVDQIDTSCGEKGVMRWAIILFTNPIELDTVPSPEETRPYKAMGQAVFAAA